MPKFNRPAVILQLCILLILIAGIGVGIYLLKSGNLKLFSKAGNDQTRLEFLDNAGSQITTTSSPEVKLKLTYVASGVKTFSLGTNVTGITHYGYDDPDPYCSTNAVYAIGGAPLPSPGSKGAGANLYVNPSTAGLSTSVTVVATSDPQCSANIRSSFAGGLGNCRGGCGDGGASDGCTCSGGNPKDNKSCWWRWTCAATSAGSYTATFGRVLQSVPASDTDVDLAEMQRMGMKVIRVFAADKNIDDSEAARRLESFLDKANSYGISAIVSLIDFYKSGFSPQGMEAYYTGNYNGIGLLGREFFAGGYSARYKDFIRTLVEANKGKSNIYAWEPGNELKWDADPQIFIAFMKDITGYIKSLDSVHKVATGMMYSSHTALSPQDLYPQLPAVDIVTVHTYDGDRNGVPDLNWAKANNKSVVVEELGFNGTGDRSISVRNDLNFWKDQGTSAVLQWGFIAKGLPDNGNGDGRFGMDTIWHTDYDALVAVFQSYRQISSSFPVSFKVANSQQELAAAAEQDFNMNGKIIDWMLTGGNGAHTVYAQFKVNGIWQEPISANISLLAPFTTQFRLAENPTDLNNASWQVYTRDGIMMDYDFQTPGQKFIFVQFKDSNNTISCGSQSYCSSQITILEPESTPSATSTPTPSASPTPNSTNSPSQTWIPPTCTNGVFSGCTLTGEQVCNNYGDPGNGIGTVQMWGICNSICNVYSGTDKNTFCRGNDLRPPLCQTTTAGNKTALNSGESITVTSTANTPVKKFAFQFYNNDNPYDASGNPRPISYSQSDPDGIYRVIAERPSPQTQASQPFTYEQLARPDLNWGSRIPQRIQINGYFIDDQGNYSAANLACVVNFTLAAASSLNSAPSVRHTQAFTPSPTPLGSSQPLSTVTPHPQVNNVTAFELIRQRVAENSRRTGTPEPTAEVSPSPNSGTIARRPLRNIPVIGGPIDYVIESVTNAWNFWKQL